LELGLHVPTAEGELEGGGAVRWPDLVAIARRAENSPSAHLGFDSLWVADHFLYRSVSPLGSLPEGPSAHGFWECWTLMSAPGAATGRIAIGSPVAGAADRNPALLARLADTLPRAAETCSARPLAAGEHLFHNQSCGRARKVGGVRWAR